MDALEKNKRLRKIQLDIWHTLENDVLTRSQCLEITSILQSHKDLEILN